ncbi:MAG: 16S rRNA (guanine(527)-N(7))-methyltransferase RsmG [Candidimonas sp.]|nr:16S rRNA (guanine(527)-N(7))-methyltransferase RsmG [Candidimonas sp.]
MGGTDNIKQRLRSAAQTLDLVIEDDEIEALLAYLRQLERWNNTYNLTALRDPEHMLVQHVFDSLAIVQPVQDILDKNTVAAPAIADIGSGPGLPGIILSIMRAQWQVRCVDAVEKKVAFMRQVASVLRLSNVQALHARVEQLEPLQADLVVSRAFASLADFARLAGRHVGPGGTLLAMKGREPVDEVRALHEETEWRVDHIQALAVPELDAQRCLVWMSRQGNL